MKVEVIRTNGRRETHEILATNPWPALERIAGCAMFDGVNLHDGRVMLVDDNGYETETIDHGGGRIELRPVKARKPKNQEATALYVMATGRPFEIVGDVIIVTDEDFA